jgi:hypothetical protein
MEAVYGLIYGIDRPLVQVRNIGLTSCTSTNGSNS